MSKSREYYNQRTKEILYEIVQLEFDNKLDTPRHIALCKELHENSDIDKRHNLNDVALRAAWRKENW